MATIFLARSIRTVDPERPLATAVAVDGDRIVGVGDLTDLVAEFPAADIDRRFDGDVLLPGFIEPHMHLVPVAMSRTWIQTFQGGVIYY